MRDQGEYGGEDFAGAGDLHFSRAAEYQVMLDGHSGGSQGEDEGRVLTARISHNKGTNGGILQEIF